MLFMESDFICYNEGELNGATMDIGLPQLIIILVIMLLLFGSSRLPKLSRSIGESARELRDGFEGKSKDSSDKSSNRSKTK